MSKGIDHESTCEIVCPWCGHEFMDSWEYESNEEEIGLVECQHCGKELYAYRNITIDYSTEKAVYGTCEKCGKKEVVIESGKYFMEYTYENYCQKCKTEYERDSMQKYLEYNKSQ